MSLGRCRACGSGKVWRSSVWRYHILRSLVDSSRRYCGACQERWISAEPVRPSARRKLFLAAVCVAIAGVVFGGAYWILRRPSRPGKAGKMAQAGGAGSGGANKKSLSGAGTQGDSADAENAAGEALIGEEGSGGVAAGMFRAGGGGGNAGWFSLVGDLASLAMGRAMGLLKGDSTADGPNSSELEQEAGGGGGGEPASEEGPPPE